MEGVVSVEIFNSKFLAGSFVVKSNNEDTFSLKYNDTNFPINNFLINASIIEEQVEIERLLISNANDKIEIEGKIENLFKDVNAILNVNITKLDISNFSNLIYKKTDNFLSNSYKISNIESGQLENTKFGYYITKITKIEKLNGKLTNAIVLKDNLRALLDQVDIISKNNNNILLSTPGFLNKNGKTISFLDNNLN